METYNRTLPWHESPNTSRNMATFSDAMKSSWMVHFLSTPLYSRDENLVYGRPHKLFDTLQVVFSYLVLNRSAMAFQVGRDKSDYDLEKVYNYDQSHALLYTRRLESEREPSPPQHPLFPNLRRESPPPEIMFKLDMHTLLHIRNFWHRHLTESKAMGGEETYSAMAANLAKAGVTPKAWTKPIQEPSKLATRWFGHYSCLYPWPKTSKALREKETEAEVWDAADPLVSPRALDAQELILTAPRLLGHPRPHNRLAFHILLHSILHKDALPPPHNPKQQKRNTHPRPRALPVHRPYPPPPAATHPLPAHAPPLHTPPPPRPHPSPPPAIRHPRLRACDFRPLQTNNPPPPRRLRPRDRILRRPLPAATDEHAGRERREPHPGRIRRTIRRAPER
jgi:hypothetical protein